MKGTRNSTDALVCFPKLQKSNKPKFFTRPWTADLIKTADNLYVYLTEVMKVKSDPICRDSEEQKKTNLLLQKFSTCMVIVFSINSLIVY